MIHMSISGNQYADKVFAEHPIALWPLDERVYYLSLIDDNDRLFSNWTLENATSSNSPTLPEISSPFDDNIYSSITSNTSSPVVVEAESSSLFSLVDTNINIKTFCVNLFLYQNPTFINWIKIGYRYDDALSVPQEVISEEILAPNSESWINLNQVYPIPESWSGSLKIFLQISFADSSGGDAASRTLIMQGLSIGQNSETTCYESLGSIKQELPDSLGFTSLYGIPSDQYGILADNGYHVVRNNRLLAKNDGFPIVFGTPQSTKIYPSEANLPSFVFPGKGMLNEAGRNKNYTLELWMKLDPETTTAKKIIGPISGNDGIYVKEGFITLVIDSEIGSHCISEWYRPLLVHLILKDSNAVLMVNGEEVINIPYNRAIASLPDDKDWWGVYSYPEISVFQIDCISIYPYTVSEIVAKRRFVYGQGTPSIQSIDNSFFGTPTTIDFTTSQYGPSVMYPDFYRWDAGYFNNLNATRDYLSVPNYSLPIINIGGRDIQQWYEDNYYVNTLEYPERNHPNFITFRPNVDYGTGGAEDVWNNAGNNYVEQCYFNFTSLNVLNDAISSVYGIFEIEDDLSQDRPLMVFSNTTNGDTFKIYVNSDTIYYSINNSVIHQEIITLSMETLVGINFENLGAQFGYEVARFFSSPSSVQIYIGGDGTTTFEGKIYIVGFCNQENFQSIEDNFDQTGIAISENYEILLNHIASYTLIPEYEYGQMFLDVSVSSEWEEYYPLNYFAGYVKDENENLVYDLDLVQVNVGYTYVGTEGVWTYAELDNAFVSETYQDLLDSVYSNYFGLYKNNTTGESVNVSNSSLNTYLTFQKLDEGSNAPLSSFSNTKSLDINSVIYADNENTIDFPNRVYDTKFVFKDNVVVYPPKTENFEDYSMVVHFDIKQRSIIKNPLRIRSMEISSKNLNYVSSLNPESQRNIIGTKFGSTMYPQKVDVLGEVDYKSENPLFIYKTTSPYLYTTKKSGIQVVNQSIADDMPSEKYMLSIPVNNNASYDFSVGAMHFFVKGSFTEEEEQINLVDINHKDGKISVVLEKSTEGNFVRAYSNDGLTLTEYPTISFYQNGRYVLSPTLINNEWNSIGISFNEQLDFSNFLNGSIDLFGGALFNNVSYYLSKGLGIKTDLTIRSWENVLNYDSVTRAWQFWDAGNQKWRDVYILGQTTSYFSSPEDIYRSYTGTNKNIIDDKNGITFQKSGSTVYSAISWRTITEKPV